MEVFYDNDGINNVLSTYSEDEINKLGIIRDYEKLQKIYYDDLDNKLRKYLKINGFFLLKNAIIHSKGETSFIVDKVRGFQRYHISESKGQLNHILEQPNSNNVGFVSFFEKMDSDNDYLDPTLYEMYIKHQICLKPQFKQIIAEKYKSNGIVFDHILYACTKIDVLPIPKYGKTLYLWRYQNVGLVPIGYAVYK